MVCINQMSMYKPDGHPFVLVGANKMEGGLLAVLYSTIYDFPYALFIIIHNKTFS